MTEKEFSSKIVNRLLKYFMISEEVWSECGKYRIDFIITHRKTGLNFGLEFKRFDRKRGEEIGEFTMSNRLIWSESKVGANYDLYNDGLHILNYEKLTK
jgi:hypothetical protein